MNIQQDRPHSRKRTVQIALLMLLCLLFLPTPTVRAAPLAQAPVPEVDDVTTEEDTPILIDVLATDSETNGNPLTLAEVGEPRNGTAEIVGNQIRYTPKANFLGRDSFFTPYIMEMLLKHGRPIFHREQHRRFTQYCTDPSL
ncbi:MAG: Ig-like domain-containing protein [Caldilineaceae bacterium]